jgi:signal transduction histidine kinase
MYKEALTDGQVPYVMDATGGGLGKSFITFYRGDFDYTLTIDLGETQPVNEVHLHAADIRENTPRFYHADYAMPFELKIEGAHQSDFSDAVLLSTFRRKTLYESGPIVMLRFPETRCRYVRLIATKGYYAPEAKANSEWRCVGFAEIEILSQGRNVARDILMKDNVKNVNTQGELANLTDGSNHYGPILPIKQWLNELALRHDLETERPFIVAELDTRYARQKNNLKIMYWIAGTFAAGLILVILTDQLLRKRQLAQARQRFAANLHDELGANLHAIGLLADTAQAEKDDPKQHDILLQRIRALTERSGTAARHCANLLEAEGLFEKVEEEMHQISERVTNDLNHSITFKGETALRQLSPRRRIDLLLFYKESLINIIRHSGATLASTHLTTSGNAIILSITDNGHGFSGGVPPSLKRRARLLRAKVTAENPDEGGTRITLTLQNRKI